MKYIITTTLIILSLGLKAQTSPPAPPIKKDSAKYNYFVIVPLNEYQLLYSTAQDYKSILIYYPDATDAQKVMLLKNTEAWIRNLPARVKLDSVKVK